MVRAWYMSTSVADVKLPNLPASQEEFLQADVLEAKTGIRYFQLHPDGHKDDGKLDKLRKERSYNYEDTITIAKNKLTDYAQKIDEFFREHIHEDEEVRYCTDGGGFFDMRDMEDKWIRMELAKGDLIILPAGIYHRFTPSPDDYIELIRLFSGVPVWTAHYRPQDDHPSRIQYLKNMAAAS